MLKSLGIVKPEQTELIFSLIDIYNGKQEGWEALAQYCCFSSKKNAQVVFKCILQIINWERLKTIKDDSSSGNLYGLWLNLGRNLGLTDDLPHHIQRILTFLAENELGAQVRMKTDTIMEIVWIIDGIVKRDLRQIFTHLRAVKDDFGLGDNKYLDLIETFIFFANKYTISDPVMRKEMILRSVDILSDWLMSLMEASPEEKKKMTEMVTQLLRLVMGAINMDKSILKEGLEKFAPMVSGLSKIWDYLKAAKEKIFAKDVSLKQVNERTIVAIAQIYMKIMNIGNAICKMKADLVKTVNDKKKVRRTQNIPVWLCVTMD